GHQARLAPLRVSLKRKHGSNGENQIDANPLLYLNLPRLKLCRGQKNKILPQGQCLLTFHKLLEHIAKFSQFPACFTNDEIPKLDHIHVREKVRLRQGDHPDPSEPSQFLAVEQKILFEGEEPVAEVEEQ